MQGTSKQHATIEHRTREPFTVKLKMRHGGGKLGSQGGGLGSRGHTPAPSVADMQHKSAKSGQRMLQALQGMNVKKGDVPTCFAFGL